MLVVSSDVASCCVQCSDEVGCRVHFSALKGALCTTVSKCLCVLQVVQFLAVVPWTFTMRSAARGALPHSALPDHDLQPYHCPIKGWRYSQVAQVCMLVVTSYVASCCVQCGDEVGCRVHFFALKGARFAPLAPNAHAFCRFVSRCFQCDQPHVDHCRTQRCPI